MLTVLSVAYPLAAVGPDAVGGAEQVLSAIDRALVRAGHRSLVIACDGSDVAGTLLGIPMPCGPDLDQATREAAWRAVRQRIAEALPSVDLVHLHGIDFESYLPPPGPPVLVTLHLPPHWYGVSALAPSRPGTWLNCVSPAEARCCPPGTNLVSVIGNGVPVEELGSARHARRSHAMMLGRVCPEKGQHLALQAARKAGIPLFLGGEVFPYPSHRAYFEDEVRPLLDRQRRFLGPLGFARKRRLLASARCLLVPSLAPETSSLVAMEALACGTPAIAFPAGALPDIVEHGRTGFLVDHVDGMADAIGRTGEIDPATCRRVAEQRFSVRAMTDAYLDLYRRLAA